MRAGSLENFPHETDHNGVCSKLDKKNMTCTIYEDRPMICRIDDYHKKYLSANVDLSIWHKYNADMCNKMINQAGIDKSFLVKLDTVALKEEK
jgi:Fe-S-cluster containining protein